MNEEDLVIGAYYETNGGHVGRLTRILSEKVVSIAGTGDIYISFLKRRVYLHDKPPELELFEGAFVELNNGQIMGPVVKSYDDDYPWRIGTDKWMSTGKYSPGTDGTHHWDVKRIVKVTVHD